MKSVEGLSSLRLGLLLPHFGAAAHRALILRCATRAAEAGIGSLWARDHLIWTPHGIDGTSRRFIDPFVALASACAVVEGCTVGTSVCIPVRPPLKLAQDYLSLAAINGGRVIAGIGAGFDDDELRAAGYAPGDRRALLEATAGTLRSAFAGEPILYKNQVVDYDRLQLSDEERWTIPLLYGGDSRLAIRRSVEFADGWLPSRIRINQLRELLAYRKSVSTADKPLYLVVQPLTVLAKDRGLAEKRIPFDDLEAGTPGLRLGGTNSSRKDLRGVVVWGTAEDVAETIWEYVSLGCGEYILDFRLQFDTILDVIEAVGSHLVPALERAGITLRRAAA